MPEAYGGAGLGITEAAIMMQAIAESGAGMSGASAVHMNIFGLNPVVVFGTDEQKQRWLPPLIAGRDKACFCVTEPDTGLDTTRLKTRAVRRGDHYVVSGRKIWISTAQVTNKMLLLARTTPIEEVSKPTQGLSLFYTDMDRKFVEAREIPKMGRKAVDSNQVFIDGLKVPVSDRIGEEGKGFEYILHGFNPERILIAAEAVGLGRAALKRAADYAKERIVFDARSARTRRSSTRWHSAGSNSRPRTCWCTRRRRSYDSGQAVRCGSERGQVPRGRSRFQGVRDRGDDPRRHGLREGISTSSATCANR